MSVFFRSTIFIKVKFFSGGVGVLCGLLSVQCCGFEGDEFFVSVRGGTNFPSAGILIHNRAAQAPSSIVSRERKENPFLTHAGTSTKLENGASKALTGGPFYYGGSDKTGLEGPVPSGAQIKASRHRVRAGGKKNVTSSGARIGMADDAEQDPPPAETTASQEEEGGVPANPGVTVTEESGGVIDGAETVANAKEEGEKSENETEKVAETNNEVPGGAAREGAPEAVEGETDGQTPFEIPDELNAAALKLQAAERGRKARSRVRGMRAPPDAVDEEAAEKEDVKALGYEDDEEA